MCVAAVFTPGAPTAHSQQTAHAEIQLYRELGWSPVDTSGCVLLACFGLNGGRGVSGEADS